MIKVIGDEAKAWKRSCEANRSPSGDAAFVTPVASDQLGG